MDDAAFIIGLMKTETDALGFIPSTAIRSRWATNGQYIIQRDGKGRRRGYLLHGRPTYGKPLHVNQVCVDYDHRLRGYAHLMVRQLIERATIAGTTEIRLRCAADLDANLMWSAAGFLPIARTIGGSRRNRLILHYALELTTARPLFQRFPIGARDSPKVPRTEDPHFPLWIPPQIKPSEPRS